ncbi:MAG: hypothetical protein ACP5D2_03380 [Candidatus Nanoarchaeia archaeon]
MTNISNEVINALPVFISEQLTFITNLLKALGVAFILYIIYMIIRGILRWKDRKRLIRVEEKIDNLEKKVDKILKNKKSKKKNKKKN